jgi:hypothetical protein
MEGSAPNAAECDRPSRRRHKIAAAPISATPRAKSADKATAYSREMSGVTYPAPDGDYKAGEVLDYQGR